MSMGTDKAKISQMLEAIWDGYAEKMSAIDHDLIVLAIPRYPSNIEAIASLDVTTIRMALRQFMNAREVADERPAIRPAEAAAAEAEEKLDARDDASGTPAQPNDAADEQGQSDAAAGAVEDVKPVFEIHCDAEVNHEVIKIFADGRVEGISDHKMIIINSIPSLVKMTINAAMEEAIPDGWWVDHDGQRQVLDHEKVATELDRLRNILRRCQDGKTIVDLGDGTSISLNQERDR